MLTRLKIKNFALIEEMDLDFCSGLTVLTGESGSGKSLILDAIASVLGNRCSSMNIRNGAEKYVIEGQFTVRNNPEAMEWLAEKGYFQEGNEIIIKKELNLEGKSKILINGGVASAALLKELGNLLSDIHRQNEQLVLLDKKNQLAILDHFAGLETIQAEVRNTFFHFKQVRKRMEDAFQNESLTRQKKEILEYQIHEIDNANLREGEYEELLKEEILLSKGEKLNEFYFGILNHLKTGDNNILDSMAQINTYASKIEMINTDFREINEGFQEIWYRLKEYSELIGDESGDLYFSQERLDLVQKRLNELHKLQKKYGNDIKNVISLRNKLETELEAISLNDETKSNLKVEFVNATANLTRLSLKLSELRKKSIQMFEEAISEVFREVGIDEGRIQLVLRWEQSPDGEINENGKKFIVTEAGLDQIDFYFSANAGEKPRPLRKIASGGEVSRIMLAIQSIMNQYNKQKLMVFDEIDTGISGKTAFNVAEKLKQISQNNQVILVTHMQQVVANADQHITVEKQNLDGRTCSMVKTILSSERHIELAKMISGKITQGSLQHAEELLGKKAG